MPRTRRGSGPRRTPEERRVHKVEHARRSRYGVTAGDRNVHVMSGRVV